MTKQVVASVGGGGGLISQRDWMFSHYKQIFPLIKGGDGISCLGRVYGGKILGQKIGTCQNSLRAVISRMEEPRRAHNVARTSRGPLPQEQVFASQGGFVAPKP